jgi:hypothetical protein
MRLKSMVSITWLLWLKATRHTLANVVRCASLLELKVYDLIQSGIFGPHTEVFLDLYLENAFGAIEMNREEIQRQSILKRWKKAGMREDDVGLMADMDETFTRDSLHAVIACDIPMFRPGQNCHEPRLFAWSLVFESSPECVSKDFRWLWFHPDVMIGECIEYIGNPQGRPTPVREYRGVHGERVLGWGRNSSDDYPKDVINNGSYPLANAADMRTGVFNYALGLGYPKDNNNLRVGAYHFHNFFETGEGATSQIQDLCASSLQGQVYSVE